MNEHPLIAHTGFSGTDMVVLNSIFNIIRKSRSDIDFTADSSTADIVFVDGDQPNADSLVEQMLEKTPKTVVKVGRSLTEQFSEKRFFTMRKPMTLRRANETLNAIFRVSRNSSEKLEELTLDTQANVLIVDDSYPVRSYMETKVAQLTNSRLTAMSADSGKGAIDLLKNNQFDLVFLDVVMPGIDGYKVCKWIKSTFPTTQVVMLSGKKSAFDKVRGSISGCDAYITKPPEDSQIQAVLDAI